MKIIPLLLLFLPASLMADLVRKEVPIVGDPSEKNILWFRDGVKIMTESPRDGHRSVQVTITPIDIKHRRQALVLSISSGHISRIHGGPALQDCKFYISDRTADGTPDLIEIFDRSANNLIEAYTITNGIVEPVPSKMLESHRSGFLLDDQKIVEYLKEKEAERGGTDQSATAPELKSNGNEKSTPKQR